MRPNHYLERDAPMPHRLFVTKDRRRPDRNRAQYVLAGSAGDDWWKVQLAASRTVGFVPAAFVGVAQLELPTQARRRRLGFLGGFDWDVAAVLVTK
jgi:hypothetical protein